MDAKSREQSHRDTIALSNKIDWNNLNYPPLFRVVHYDSNELEGKIKTFSGVCNQLLSDASTHSTFWYYSTY